MRSFLKLQVLLMLFSLWNDRLMADCVTGRTGGAVSGNVNYGSSINWANPNRSLISDDLYARTSINSGQITKYLEVKDFQFSVPSNATITGIAVFIEKYRDAGSNIRDNSVRLQLNGILIGTDKAVNALWPLSDSVSSYGGYNDTWGATLTPADVNGSTFGVLMAAYIPAGGSSTNYFAHIDHMVVDVYFTTPPNTCGPYALPVSLAEFKASVINNSKVKLNWTTLSESNNHYFSVERSAEGIYFDELARVTGAGNSNVLLNYQIFDEKPFEGTTYYRLKQVDYDGTETIAKKMLAASVMSNTPEKIFMIFPNPGNGTEINYAFTAEPREEAFIYIEDYTGKRIVFEKIDLSNNSGSARDLFFSKKLIPGIYMVRVTSADLSCSHLLKVN